MDPVLSPDGIFVAYVSFEIADQIAINYGLWVAYLDGTKARQLYPAAFNGVAETISRATIGLPKWSKDGRWLACIVGDGQQNTRNRVCVVDVATGQYQILAEGNILSIKWSLRESTRLYYCALSPVGQRLYRALDVTNPDSQEMQASFPWWSPEGLEYILNKDRKNILLCQDGRTIRELELGVILYEPWIWWSPDGQKIACKSKEKSEELFVIDNDGRNRRKLIGHERYALQYMPVEWSPDSTWLAGFGRSPDRPDDWSCQLYIVNVITGEVRELVKSMDILPMIPTNYEAATHMAWTP